MVCGLTLDMEATSFTCRTIMVIHRISQLIFATSVCAFLSIIGYPSITFSLNNSFYKFEDKVAVFVSVCITALLICYIVVPESSIIQSIKRKAIRWACRIYCIIATVGVIASVIACMGCTGNMKTRYSNLTSSCQCYRWVASHMLLVIMAVCIEIYNWCRLSRTRISHRPVDGLKPELLKIMIEIVLTLIHGVHWLLFLICIGSVGTLLTFRPLSYLETDSGIHIPLENFICFSFALLFNTWACSSHVSTSAIPRTIRSLDIIILKSRKMCGVSSRANRIVISITPGGEYYDLAVVVGQIANIALNLRFMSSVSRFVPSGEWTFAMVLLLFITILITILRSTHGLRNSVWTGAAVSTLNGISHLFFVVYTLNTLQFSNYHAFALAWLGSEFSMWISKIFLILLSQNNFYLMPVLYTMLRLSLLCRYLANSAYALGNIRAIDVRGAGEVEGKVAATRETQVETLNNQAVIFSRTSKVIHGLYSVSIIGFSFIAVGFITTKYFAIRTYCDVDWGKGGLTDWCYNTNLYPNGIWGGSACNCLIVTVPNCHNGLNKTIPAEVFEQFDTATVFSAASCHLIGEIPEEIGVMKKLKSLFIYINEMEGSIPGSIGNLTQLELLDLAYNKFTGPIPDGMGNLISVSYLTLGSNSLEGQLDGSVLSKLTKLRFFSSERNQFTGPLPRELENLASLEALQLATNHFEGQISETLCKLPRLNTLLLSRNRFNGTLPQCLKAKDRANFVLEVDANSFP